MVPLRTATTGSFFLAIALVQAGVQVDRQVENWLREHIETGRLEDSGAPAPVHDQAALRHFYESNGFNLAWIRRNQPTAQALTLISSIRAAGVKGLDPEDYDGSRWASRLSGIQQGAIDAVTLSRFDLELTIAAMRFVSDLDSGRANPGIFHFDSGVRGSSKLATWIHDKLQYAPADPDAIAAALQSLEPPFPSYRTTQDALARYRSLLADGQPDTFPSTKHPLKPGDPYSAAPRLYAFLRRLGDAPQSGPIPDDYSGFLAVAVARF